MKPKYWLAFVITTVAVASVVLSGVWKPCIYRHEYGTIPSPHYPYRERSTLNRWSGSVVQKEIYSLDTGFMVRRWDGSRSLEEYWDNDGKGESRWRRTASATERLPGMPLNQKPNQTPSWVWAEELFRVAPTRPPRRR